MNITIYPSNSYRRDRFEAAGEDVAGCQEIGVDAASLSAASRAHLARLSPTIAKAYTLEVPTTTLVEGACAVVTGTRVWPAPFVPEDPAGWDTLLERHAEALAAASAERATLLARALDRRIDLMRAAEGLPAPKHLDERWRVGGDQDLDRYPEALALFEALEARVEAGREARVAEQARQRAEQAREEREHAAAATAWIAEHGSAHLRQAREAGHPCELRYLAERAALEYPGYEIDSTDDAAWEPLDSPTEAALAEALRVGGEAVLLTYPTTPDGPVQPALVASWNGAMPCEAVVIRPHPGRPCLVRTVGPVFAG